MNVAILGAGNGGVSAVVELGRLGFRTQLWNRSRSTLEPYFSAGGIRYSGVFGEGIAELDLMTTDLAEALKDVDVILVCLPTFAHAHLAKELVKLEINTIPVVLNPGHTGGVLSFIEIFNINKLTPPPVAEFSTLSYVARKPEPDKVWITGSAKHVWVASMPGDDIAIQVAQQLYPVAQTATDVIFSSLANVNMVLHTPGTILGAAWIESTAGDFTFYVQGLPDGVGKIMEALDAERLAVAAAFGHEMPTLFDEMRSIGTIEPDAEASAGVAVAVRSGKANSKIKAPDSLSHRYYIEDFWYGLKPFLVFAKIAGVDVPIASSLMNMAEVLTGDTLTDTGRTAVSMGIDGMAKNDLLKHVRR